ncbi:hypothetical protein THOM_0244 [Trachipleistophora hominis]|uniref:Uncharacterized protein n=1 Tax=Trachipleistophora hominis TaxID=72359 RepID=L7JZN1_TRAHO|nr:hypothetical protein THOM_0244 [Trachipleistophora hominis]
MMVSDEEQKMILINSLENQIKNISLIFNIIHDHIEKLEEKSRINQEPIKEECKDIISTFKTGTKTYSTTMKKLMDDVQDDQSFYLERTDDLFEAKDTYVEIMDETFYILGGEYPFEVEIAAKFKEGHTALNQEPDIEGIFAGGEKWQR